MADGDQLIIGNTGVGRNNDSNATTRLNRDGGAASDALVVENNNGLAIYGDGLTTPTAPRGIGVYGFARAWGDLIAAPGVFGESTNGTGVRGVSQMYGFGVHGRSWGTGVRGDSLEDGPGVHGRSSGTGVRGESSADGSGVAGSSSSGFGVRGESRES